MAERPHLLVVEDEDFIRTPLVRYLERNSFRVTAVADAAQAREVLATAALDLAILDLMLPGEDGLSLARFVRATSTLPILMLTARAEDIDKIVGLEMGRGRLCDKAVQSARVGGPHPCYTKARNGIVRWQRRRA